jgi:DNA-binding CsgD family transcriptional regulator
MEFVGRRAERELIRSNAEASRSGEARWVSICGAPGLGKSALLGEVRRELESSAPPLVFVETHTDATRRTPPYGTLEPIVRSVIDALALPVAAVDSPGLALIAPHLAGADQAARAEGLELGHAEQAVDAFLARLVGHQLELPLCIAIDDVHHADEQSIRAVLRLFLSQPTASVLILSARRPSAIVVNPTLEAAIERASRTGRFAEPVLGPLTSEEAEELGKLLGMSRLEREGLARSAGNPLVIRWFAGGNPAHDVGRFVGVATRDLEAGERTALELFALYGRPLPRESLLELTGLGEGGTPFLDRLCRRMILKEEERVAFYHDLVREQVLEEIAGSNRADLHARLGRILLAVPWLDATRRDLDAGYHLVRSREAADRLLGLEHARRAAERAESAGAWEDAAAIWRDVRAHTPDEDTLAIADAELGLGRCLIFKPVAYPERYEGQALVVRATRTYLEEGDVERLVAVAGKRNSLIEFELIDAWERAAQMVPREHPGAAVVRYRRAWNRQFVFPDIAFMKAGMESVAEVIDEETPEWLRLAAEAGEHRARFLEGDDSAASDLEALLPRIRSSSDPVERIWWLKQLASTLRKVGHVERARSLALEAVEAAETARGIDSNFVTVCQSLVQRLDLARGNWDEVIRLGAIETTATRTQAVLALYYSGRTREADELVETLLPGLENDPSHWLPIANTLVHMVSVRACCTGEDRWLDEAAQWARELVDAPAFNPHFGLQVATGCARIAFLRRDLDGLIAAQSRLASYPAMEEYYDRHLLLRARAQCAWGLRKREVACRLLESALRWCDHFHDLTMRAWTHADLATILAELGRDSEANRHRERAVRLARELGLLPLSDRLEDDPALSGARRLTPREREVLALLAEGLSDKEIAARLEVSTYTAGNHVRHIREKLHSASRSEAAAAALRLGLVE